MNFSIKDYDQRVAIKTEKILLLFSGFYPRRKNDNSYIWLYRVSAFLNLFVAYGQLFSMVVQMIIDRRNISKLTETLLFFMTHFTFICKLMNFLFYKKKMFEIENILTESAFYSHVFDRLTILKNRVESCQNVAKIFRVLCLLVVLFYALVPNLDYKEEKTLPLPGWLPYDINKFYYESIAFQVLSIAVSAYNNSSIDVLTCMLITVASAQIDILKENLKEINYKADSENTKTIIEQKLTDCVKHHKMILRLSYQIEAMFSKGILLQFFTSVVVICFTGFQMIVVPIPSVQFVLLLVYFSCMMCQIAMYCWYGHEIITTSDSIGQYFYMSNWYEAEIRIRKNMLIFLERSKKPIILTAGNFVTLSLNTLTTILRSSYSYFAVLQRLYKNS